MENGNVKNNTPNQTDTYIMVLEQSYENLRALYTNLTQWAAILTTAWAVITGFGLQKDSKSFLLVFIGGVLLVLISYLINRAGIGLGSTALTTLIYEKRLMIQQPHSFVIGTLLRWRGYKFTKQLVEYCDSGDAFGWEKSKITGKSKEMDESVYKRHDYNLFGITHSKTTLIILFIGILQMIFAAISYYNGTLPLFS